MFNIRPDKRWFGFNVEPFEDPPGFRMNADGTVRDASPGDSSTAFPGIGPGDSAALPGGTMFNVRPEQHLPGLHNFRPPKELVPGFRMNADGSIRTDAPVRSPYPDVGSNPFGLFGPQGLGTNAFTPVGDGSPPPYLAYGARAYNGQGGASTLVPSTGMAPFALPSANPLSSDTPYFDGAETGGATPSPFSLRQQISDDGPPPGLFSYTANPLMSGQRPPLPSFAEPIPGDGLADNGSADVDAQSTLPAPDGLRPAPGGTADSNIVLAGGGEWAAEDGDVQVAQAQPAPSASPPGGESTSQTTTAPPATQRPGRGYGTTPQSQIESGMTELQRQINRDQAFRELTRQPLTAAEARYALPDDWETTKPANLVDEIKRAAERHGVPVQLLARLLYQEGKFGERARGRPPLVMHSTRRHEPIGYAQMTRTTFEDLIRRARARGDTKRAQELQGYSLANSEQSFDAAAEQLAYLYRLMGGSWPKAVAGYNVGPTAIKNWFDGVESNTKETQKYDPMYFAATGRDKDGNLIATKKWTDETARYLRYVLRGATEDPAIGDMYGYQPPEQYRARAQIPRRPAPSGQPTVPSRRRP